MIGASVAAERHERGKFCGIAEEEILAQRSLTEVAYVALLGLAPQPANLFAFQTLVGLLLTNGPGAISAQGAKGAVSADGPETPERVQLNKALVGFLTHSGYTHGGNGFEGIAFLIKQFHDSDLADPTNPNHGVDLNALALRYVDEYARYKTSKKTAGSLDIQKIPGVNHPVFKDRPVNLDPREVFIRELFEKRGEYNIFHDYYRALVQALFDAGVSRNVYCVNIDAVIAALLLKILWQPLPDRRLPRTGDGDGRVHDLPLPADARLRSRNRRSPEPRPEHGYADAGVAVPLRRLNPESDRAKPVRIAAPKPQPKTGPKPAPHSLTVSTTHYRRNP